MRVTIPDKTMDQYLLYAERMQKPVDTVIAQQLARFSALDPQQRAVVIGADVLDTLDQQLGAGQVKDGDDLLAKIGRLAAITFHNVRLDFTPNQLEELAHRAERQGTTVEALAADIIRQLTEQFFWGTGGGAAGHAFQPTQGGPAYDRATDMSNGGADDGAG